MKNIKKQKKIAIIGAGASGLSLAFELQKLGFHIDIFEKNVDLGGIAGATQLSKGRIDSFYHHLFKSDKYILSFLKKYNIPTKIIFKRTSTAHVWDDKLFDISSILKIKSSKLLSNWGLFRLLLGGALIKYAPVPEKLNRTLIHNITGAIFGKEAASKIWDPLLNFKFGKYAKLLPYSWLRARIKDRTIELGYLSQGFEVIYEYLAKEIKSNGGNVFTNCKIEKINLDSYSKKLVINNKTYDKAVITTPPDVNKIILKDINYKSENIKYLGAVCGILEFNKRPVKSYWTGIADTNLNNHKSYKNFLAAISYAELDDNWNEKDIPTWPLYLAAYCTKSEFERFSQETWKEKMIEAAIELNNLSKLEKIDANNLINFKLSFTNYAQPILSPSENLPPNPETAELCYFSNMHNIFPNDRGQNRSFFLAKKLSQKIYKDLNT